jgi:hypothetical protein
VSEAIDVVMSLVAKSLVTAGARGYRSLQTPRDGPRVCAGEAPRCLGGGRDPRETPGMVRQSSGACRARDP